MNIYENYHITKAKHQDVIVTNLFGKFTKFFKEVQPETYKKLLQIKRYHVSKKHTEDEVIKLIKDLQNEFNIEGMVKLETNTEVKERVIDKELTLQKIINFFSEFGFEPNFRFCNTLSRNSGTIENAQKYVANYFKLTDNGYTNAIIDKMKSDEFRMIINELKAINTTTKINNRFKLFYGSQGTGKTTNAMIEAKDCMVCHSAMLPSDLMEDFEFVDGKANFKPSALCNAMTNGTIIALDEINLLPFESLRFLQSLLDGKKQFVYKGNTIEIKDGFKIVGTMNLRVNGSTFALPDPLVDRAEDLQEFKLTAKDLINAI